MITLLLCLAVIIVVLAWRASRVPIRHRWRRRQARIMSEALRGRGRGRGRCQAPALIYARLPATDALLFEGLLFERCGYRLIRDHRYTGDGEINGQVIDVCTWPIQAKRYIISHVATAVSLCAAQGIPRFLGHAGRTGGSRRDTVMGHAMAEIVSGRQLPILITGGPLVISGRVL